MPNPFPMAAMRRRALLAALPLPLLAFSRGAPAAAIADGEEVTLPADPSGRLRWTARAERGQLGRSVVLALRGPGRTGVRWLWSRSWRDAYEPTLRAVPDWRHRGRGLVALTLRYGAGAQEAIFFAHYGAGPPRPVAERLSSAVEWRTDARGRTLLVAYGREGSALAPSCLGWDGGALMPVPCGSLSGPRSLMSTPGPSAGGPP